MKTVLLAVGLAALFAASQAFSADTAPAASADEAASLDAQAKSFCQVKAFRGDMDRLTAPIRSMRDLFRHVHAPRERGDDSPLDVLSVNGKKRFLASLTFNESGLTGYSHDDLGRELTVSQAYEILSLFGAQDDIRLIPNLRVSTQFDKDLYDYARQVHFLKRRCPNGDWIGYACVAPATCAERMRHICKSNC